MMNPEKKHKLSDEEEENRLSTLPKDVLDAILTRLPLRDAVRTSVLSRSWRYHWTSISQLVFDRVDFALSKNQSQTEFDNKLVKVIDQVLILHRGPITKFQLTTSLASCLDIDRWIDFVSRNGIRELTLVKLGGKKYKIPSCLFYCVNISYLELDSCIFAPPASFEGFSNLRTLSLDNISFSNSRLENLISSCPLLNKLVLRSIDGCTHLKLSAPNLVALEVVGEDFEDICFHKTPILAKVSINLWGEGEYLSIASGDQCEFVDLISSLPSLRTLELRGHTYQMMSAYGGHIPVRLPTTCQLLHLSLSIFLEDAQEMLAALCIFRSATFLQKLDIESLSIGWDEVSDGFWEAQEDFNGLFTQLQILNVTECVGSSPELKFIEFVLANAPVLEMVHIKLNERYTAHAGKTLRKLIRLRRISSKAEIVVPE